MFARVRAKSITDLPAGMFFELFATDIRHTPGVPYLSVDILRPRAD